MYAAVEWIEAWAEAVTRTGGLADYFDAFRTRDGLQGGFIWEWVDHGIRQTDERGREY